MCNRPLLLTAGALLTFVAATALARLSADDTKLLQDPGGWEYVTVSDQDSGVQTQHTCFDGQPHPGQCSGKMTFTPAKTFVQQVSIHGTTVSRNGTYKIENDQLSFFDEFGTRDGPYTMQLSRETKMLVLSMPQVRLELELEKQYKDNLEHKQPPPH
jgi:hypothetical protein